MPCVCESDFVTPTLVPTQAETPTPTQTSADTATLYSIPVVVDLVFARLYAHGAEALAGHTTKSDVFKRHFFVTQTCHFGFCVQTGNRAASQFSLPSFLEHAVEDENDSYPPGHEEQAEALGVAEKVPEAHGEQAAARVVAE